MTNIFQDPFEIQDDTSCSLHQLSNYVTDSYIFLSNSDIISWCYLYFFMCFYFWIVYLVFFLYKSEYAFRLYHADDDAGQQYCCCSPNDDSAESDDDNKSKDKESKDDANDLSDKDSKDSKDDANDLSDKDSKDDANELSDKDSKDSKDDANELSDKDSKDDANELSDNSGSNKCNDLPPTISISEIMALNTKHFEYNISDNAKLFMLYDFYTKSFWYYINQQSLVDFNTLEIIALQYVTKYNCMSIFTVNGNGLGYFGVDVAGVAGVASVAGVTGVAGVDETTKSSVYASFKKNKRIETSDKYKSSLYTNHYRYMGKLLDYEEFKSHQVVMLKYNQSCKQDSADRLTYHAYHDYKTGLLSHSFFHTEKSDVMEIHNAGIRSGSVPSYKILNIGEVSKYASVLDISGASVAQINAVEDPIISLLYCSTNDDIPDHEKLD